MLMVADPIATTGGALTTVRLSAENMPHKSAP